MHKQVEKLDRHFHKFLALRSQGKRLVTAAIWPSIKDADKAPPSARFPLYVQYCGASQVYAKF